MKKILLNSIAALTLLFTGAFINEAFRADSAHRQSLARAPHVENSLVDAPPLHKQPSPNESRDVRLSTIPDTKTPDTELLRLRGQTAGLKSEVTELKTDRDAMLARKALEHRLGRTDLKIAETPGQPFQSNTYFPAALIQDVGNDTAPAALQSFIAAMTRGDYQTVVRLSPAENQERLQMLADKQLLGKYVTSDSDGIKIDAFSQTASESEFVAEIDFGENKPPVRAHFYVTNELGSWKVRSDVTIEGGQ